MTIRGFACRIQDLGNEKVALNNALNTLVADTAPSLLELVGVGVVTAAALLVAAGDNPERLVSEGSWANLCGVAPIPTGSGKTSGRVRLNRGGNRQANAALHRIVVVRMAHDTETRRYVQRRLEEGLSKPESMRCLKRYVARQIFKHISQTT